MIELDLTKPETYEMLSKEKLYPTALVRKYNLDITPECLRFRLRAYLKDGTVKIAKRSEQVTRAQLQGWVDRGLTISQVYLETNIPHNFIYKACATYNLKLKDGRSRAKNKLTNVAKVEELVKQGLNAKEVAKLTDLSYQRAKDYVNLFTERPIQPRNTVYETARMSLLTGSWGGSTIVQHL